MSKFSSNFRRCLPCLRVCHLTSKFTARWFALFVGADQRHYRLQARLLPARAPPGTPVASKASVVSPGCSSSSEPLAFGLTFGQRGRRGSDQTTLPCRHQRLCFMSLFFPPAAEPCCQPQGPEWSRRPPSTVLIASFG